MASDIEAYEPKVKCMKIVDYGTGRLAQLLADQRLADGSTVENEFTRRLLWNAKMSYLLANKNMPTDNAIKQELAAVCAVLNTYSEPSSTSKELNTSPSSERAACSSDGPKSEKSNNIFVLSESVKQSSSTGSQKLNKSGSTPKNDGKDCVIM
jgi:hypothetical protein